MNQPINKVKWIDRSKLKPNNYNPNMVAPPELKLLKISIMEDGWTQPIVINPDYTIVDGFHRWTISGDKDILKLTEGKVPVVIMEPKDENHQMMSTIRHNRARGTHAVLRMSDIVSDLQEQGLSQKEIEQRLQMEDEEVIRLLNRKGLPAQVVDSGEKLGSAWVPKKNG
jgi:ParB-like chromosome segregation protein Spo0J